MSDGYLVTDEALAQLVRELELEPRQRLVVERWADRVPGFTRPPDPLPGIARAIVNQLLDRICEEIEPLEVPIGRLVGARQAVNDECDAYVLARLREVAEHE